MRSIATFCVLASIYAPAQTVSFSGSHSRSIKLNAGQLVEVYAGLPSPSELPPNGRIAVEWRSYRKILHAFDPDFFILFRAPSAGSYTLKITKVEDEDSLHNKPRWRENGTVEKLTPFPKRTPWPDGKSVKLRTWLKPVIPGKSQRGMVLEAEPNDSIADAQPVELTAADQNVHITGGADDIEYFDNGAIGTNGIDYFRIEYKGAEPRLFTANLALPDPLVVAQLLFYAADGKEYREGANPNERVHQQTEGHRTAMSRILKPGGVYFLKVESNSPGYDVELRIRKPAPYSDPRDAIRQAMYDHLGQVDAWLLNRPRGAAVDRRIRDTGSLLGTHCMSCHTQSGVWGPTGPLKHGYRIENVANYRHLQNLAYESMRPTNELAEAANNTSLAPLDLGDGPAGTRVAGFNVTTLEEIVPARRLHSAQQIRAANFVLQSADPSGINAAGPGSNIGQALVYRFAGEILKRAWLTTRNPKYINEIEEKAKKMVKVNPRFSDDLANRILFFKEVFTASDFLKLRGDSDENKAFAKSIDDQVAEDARRLRELQRENGMWQFDPGTLDKVSNKWKPRVDDKDIDPAPTALAITALHALGFGGEDPQVKKAVDALLRKQDPFGRWNEHALTGFVTTAYTLQALARLYPVNDAKPTRADFTAPAAETLADSVARYRALAQLGLSPIDRQFTDIALDGARHESPMVRYWAFIALGALHDERGVTTQIAGLEDPVKMVREAARWGLRQTLLDDKGWDYLFPALAGGSDLMREWAAGALMMRADTVMSRSAVGWPRLTKALNTLMLDDPHPAARAWATRAAWNWWIWNPPVRGDLNRTFLSLLERDEPSALAENAERYQTEALFIANGQRANGSKEHQYPELSQFFDVLDKKMESPSPALVRRVVNIAATFYNQAGGDGGPGQMGYVTAKSSDAIGKAVFAYWNGLTPDAPKDALKLALESAANITYEPLQKRLLDYSTTGPEEFRTLAATSLADPRVITLNASQEFVEPLMEQVHRGASETERRVELVGPIIKLFSRARWNMPKIAEQQNIFYNLLIPEWAPERGKLEENTRALLQMDKDSTDWYLARSISRIIHNNSDLQTEALARRLPESFTTPMQEMLWLDSAKWLMTWETPIPEVRSGAPLSDPHKAIRDRSAALVARQLTNRVDGRLRGGAIGLAASNTAVRNHKVVKAALQPIQPGLYEEDPAEAKQLSAGWKANYDYFRDWVVPELQRPNRDDEFACLTCHGQAGRVPSMELKPAEDRGYMKARDVFANYKILLERVNELDVEASKLLRKPLNVQTGKEDGHQGGRRYNPDDRAYQILRRWVQDAASLKKAGATDR